MGVRYGGCGVGVGRGHGVLCQCLGLRRGGRCLEWGWGKGAVPVAGGRASGWGAALRGIVAPKR